MKAVQTYSKEQALQASDPHSPFSFAIQQSGCPSVTDRGLKGNSILAATARNKHSKAHLKT